VRAPTEFQETPAIANRVIAKERSDCGDLALVVTDPEITTSARGLLVMTPMLPGINSPAVRAPTELQDTPAIANRVIAKERSDCGNLALDGY
jgi:hypothetical protein